MVYPDMSAPESLIPQSKKSSFTVAPVADRMVALMLDFLIFSPIISLFIAGLVRQSKTFFILHPTSLEGAIALGLIAVMIFFFATLLQSVFLYFWQATPGQLFTQLRVVSYPEASSRLSFNQCVTRSFFWSFSYFLLAMPFLEILSHPKRRCFHERSSDTLVVTLKKIDSDAPHFLETRFISTWMRIGFSILLSIAVISFFKTYYGLQAGAYQDTTEKVASTCDRVFQTADLDTSIAFYLVDGGSQECLKEQADRSLWFADKEQTPYAYFARSLIVDGEEQEAYIQAACQEAQHPACLLSQYMNAKEENTISLEPFLEVSKVAQVLVIEERMAQKDFLSALALIETLQKNDSFEVPLERKYVKAVWALREELLDVEEMPLRGLANESGPSLRNPASSDKGTSEEASWLQDFKERYDIQ